MTTHLCLVLLLASASWAQLGAAPGRPTIENKPSCCPQATSDKQQALWEKLRAAITDIDDRLNGVLGVAIVDLNSGQMLLLRGDEIFPQASTIKIAVLAELYRQAHAGKLKLTDQYTIQASDLVSESDALFAATPGVTRVTYLDLAAWMNAVSDNTAGNILIERVGMENVNRLLDSLGLKNTRLRRRMMDLKAASEGRENVSTPREMATLLEAIYRGKVLDPDSTRSFFKLMSESHTHYQTYFRAGGIPAEVAIAEKEGQLEGVRNDAGVIYVQERPFVLCVMTTYLLSERQGEEAISRIAGEAYRMFDRLGRASAYGRVVSPRDRK